MSVPVKELIAALERENLVRGVRGGVPESASGVADDSRSVASGDVFVAMPGALQDGHNFVTVASAKGAVLALVAREDAWPLPVVVVSDPRHAAIIAADFVYRHPAAALRLAGVTGTNGKTTTVHLARVVLAQTRGRAASLGTLGVLEGKEGRAIAGGTGLTTPSAVELRRVLRRLVDRGVRYGAMEVSSHSLVQNRVDGIALDAAVFTTFTRDHLDYHSTMEEYFRAKERLLEHLGEEGTAVVNLDDPSWTALRIRQRMLTFGLKSEAGVCAERVRNEGRGSTWTLRVGSEMADVRLPLIGEFNISNALAAAAIAHLFGASVEGIADSLSGAPQVPGRFEVLADFPLILRDYAHTPDALERSLTNARRLTSGELVVVFGCGGDRDKGKRPLMGGVAAALADRVIVTSDNPRTEDPGRIMDDIVAGMPPGSYEREEDRREAIQRAITAAAADDTVLIAGKGHETHQIRGSQAYPFDEKEIVNELLAVRR